MRQRRKAAYMHHKNAGEMIIPFIKSLPIFQQEENIAAYWPQGSELDCRPLMQFCVGLGKTVFLPYAQTKNRLLQFRPWCPLTPLIKDDIGCSAPMLLDRSFTFLIPKIILVPLLAFDKQGHRLGQGGGYYDVTLNYCRQFAPIMALGLAFDEQENEKLPLLISDEKLNGIITPTRYINW